jgi:hypothetical protein
MVVAEDVVVELGRLTQPSRDDRCGTLGGLEVRDMPAFLGRRGIELCAPSVASLCLVDAVSEP